MVRQDHIGKPIGHTFPLKLLKSAIAEFGGPLFQVLILLLHDLFVAIQPLCQLLLLIVFCHVRPVDGGPGCADVDANNEDAGNEGKFKTQKAHGIFSSSKV